MTILSAASPRETLGSRLPVRLLVIALLTLGGVARGATFQSPLFDFHSWRQSDSASIARNFFEERFNPLYPQVDWRGDAAHGYVETGFELHALIVAGLAHVFGFSTHLGRLVNALMFPVPRCCCIASSGRATASGQALSDSTSTRSACP